jgi:hypothetical protein
MKPDARSELRRLRRVLPERDRKPGAFVAGRGAVFGDGFPHAEWRRAKDPAGIVARTDRDDPSCELDLHGAGIDRRREGDPHRDRVRVVLDDDGTELLLRSRQNSATVRVRGVR